MLESVRTLVVTFQNNINKSKQNIKPHIRDNLYIN